MSILRKQCILWAATLIGAVAGAGCATNSVSEAHQHNLQQEIYVGTVIDVHPILIEPRPGSLDSVATQAGNRSSGAVLAAISGGTLGHFAGAKVEEIVRREDGYEIFVQLDSGQVISVVQPARIYEPSIGDPVIISGERVRYNPAYQ